MLLRRVVGALLLLFCHPTALAAARRHRTRPQRSSSSPLRFSPLLSSCGLVVLLVVATAWLLPRSLATPPAAPGGGAAWFRYRPPPIEDDHHHHHYSFLTLWLLRSLPAVGMAERDHELTRPILRPSAPSSFLFCGVVGPYRRRPEIFRMPIQRAQVSSLIGDQAKALVNTATQNKQQRARQRSAARLTAVTSVALNGTTTDIVPCRLLNSGRYACAGMHFSHETTKLRRRR